MPIQADQSGCDFPAGDRGPARAQTLERSNQPDCGSRVSWVWVVLVLVLGVMLRVLFFQDMEYKGDERWTFERTQAVGVSKPFPWLGMRTSASVKHPGGSLWVFLGLARVTGATTPEGLGLACMAVNSLALVLLAVFAYLCVPREEREPWLWAVALAAVNPIHVLLHRKIWPPSILPIFVMLFLFAWWYRHRRAGAFAWGLAGALLGQVHPAGLFFAAGFVAWAGLWDRAQVRWRCWLGGAGLGCLTLLPWLVYVAREMATGHVSSRSVSNALKGQFFWRWLTESLGLADHPCLGRDLLDLLHYPWVAGQPLFLVGLAYLLLAAVVLVILARACRWLWRQRGRWGALWRGSGSPSAFTVGAALWGFGLVFTLTLLPVRRHYMALAFPFMFVWLARLVLASQSVAALPRLTGRGLLLFLCLAHLIITLGHLEYIHENRHRPLGGGYGIPYSGQVEGQPPLGIGLRQSDTEVEP